VAAPDLGVAWVGEWPELGMGAVTGVCVWGGLPSGAIGEGPPTAAQWRRGEARVRVRVRLIPCWNELKWNP
jgi:hypothetical protein